MVNLVVSILKYALSASTVVLLPFSSSLVFIIHAIYQPSQLLSFASFSYLWTIRSSILPLRNDIWPPINLSEQSPAISNSVNIIWLEPRWKMTRLRSGWHWANFQHGTAILKEQRSHEATKATLLLHKPRYQLTVTSRAISHSNKQELSGGDVLTKSFLN